MFCQHRREVIGILGQSEKLRMTIEQSTQEGSARLGLAADKTSPLIERQILHGSIHLRSSAAIQETTPGNALQLPCMIPPLDAATCKISRLVPINRPMIIR